MDWKSSLEALKAGMAPEPEENPGVNSAETSGADGSPKNAAGNSAKFNEKARLDIVLDRKGRKGKAATIVAGFTVSDAEVEEIARKLKQRLGVGGSSRGGEILIQGDKRREVAAALTDLGLKNRII